MHRWLLGGTYARTTMGSFQLVTLTPEPDAFSTFDGYPGAAAPGVVNARS